MLIHCFCKIYTIRSSFTNIFTNILVNAFVTLVLLADNLTLWFSFESNLLAVFQGTEE